MQKRTYLLERKDQRNFEQMTKRLYKHKQGNVKEAYTKKIIK